MAGYLFVHFIGEQENGEQIYFAVSEDGLHWQDLNGGQPVLISDIGEAGVRDPFIVRDEKNHKFYLIATDLGIGSGKGWEWAVTEASRDLIVWESEDMVNWSRPRSCHVGVDGAGCVWAPETIYDTETESFFVFWASMVKLDGDEEPKQRIYAAYTKDFVNFTEPFVYEEADCHVIDMNIVYSDGWYYRFVKDETNKNIRTDRVAKLGKGIKAEPIHSEVLSQLFGVEGPETYQLPDGRWCLIVDQFATHKGYLPLICDDLATGNFQVAQEGSYDLGKLKKRHGGIMQITEEELTRLKQNF